MTRTTIAKRLSAFTGSKNSIAYEIAKDISTGANISRKVTGSIIRPVYTTGSRRHIQNQDHTQSCETMLTMLKIKFVTGNDAPRGGLTGNFIKIITKIAD